MVSQKGELELCRTMDAARQGARAVRQRSVPPPPELLLPHIAGPLSPPPAPGREKPPVLSRGSQPWPMPVTHGGPPAPPPPFPGQQEQQQQRNGWRLQQKLHHCKQIDSLLRGTKSVGALEQLVVEHKEAMNEVGQTAGWSATCTGEGGSCCCCPVMLGRGLRLADGADWASFRTVMYAHMHHMPTTTVWLG